MRRTSPSHAKGKSAEASTEPTASRAGAPRGRSSCNIPGVAARLRAALGNYQTSPLKNIKFLKTSHQIPKKKISPLTYLAAVELHLWKHVVTADAR